MTLSFDQPAALFLGLIALPLVVIGWRSLAGVDRVRRVTILALRTLVIAAIAVLLAGPHARREHDHLTVIGLLDVSGSVRRFAEIPAVPDDPTERRTYLEHLRQWFRDASATRGPQDRFGLVVFDGEAVAVAAPTQADLGDENLDITIASGTSIADAIRLGLAMFPAGTAKRLVLVTDGNETIGDSIEAAREAAAAHGVPIDILPIMYSVDGDVQITRVETPPAAQPGQTVTVRIIMQAAAPIRGLLTLRREGRPVDLNGDAPGRSRQVELPAGQSVLLAAVELDDTPVNRFEAIFEPEDPQSDAFPDNNRAEAFIPTPGRGRILIVAGRQGESALGPILGAAELPVVTLSPASFPNDLLSLQNYDLVVLDDVAAYDLTSEQHMLVSRYVNDLGGGLIMLGGENSFGAGGWNGTKVEEVLPLELDPPKELRLPQAALVLVLDQSGSMNQPVAGARATQQQVANEAAAIAIESLRAESLVGVVTFHQRATEYVPLQRNDDPSAIAARVRRIRAGGGTDLEPALRMAYRMLKDVDADRKRIVCLTDGQTTEDANLEGLVERMVAENIKLSTIAVGNDADQERLKKLAEIGEGEFYPVYNPKALPRVLVDSVKSINKPLIKEGVFVPVVEPTGSQLTAGLLDARTLGGLVVTARRDDPLAMVEMTHPDGEPLLAQWQAGLGRVAAFTSDVGGPWSETWNDWPNAVAFWVQLARTIARPAVSHDAELLAEIRDGRLELMLEAADTEDGFIDYLRVVGTVYTPDGEAVTVRLSQTAPGRYETSIPARVAGNYIVALNPVRGARQLSPVIGGASQTTGAEFRRYDANIALLERVANLTGGRRLDLADPLGADLFDRADMGVSVSLLPAWRAVAWIIIAIILFDIGGRRIAWSAAAIRRQAARAIARVKPAHLHGQEAATTLASLREVSARFDETVGTGAGDTTPLPPPPKIDASLNRPASPAPEPSRVRSALGALLGRPSRTPPETPPQEPDDEDTPTPSATPAPEPPREGSTPTTSGLLAAKRRARERLDRDESV